MSDATRERMRVFHQPHNERLRAQLATIGLTLPDNLVSLIALPSHHQGLGAPQPRATWPDSKVHQLAIRQPSTAVAALVAKLLHGTAAKALELCHG